MSWLRLRAWAFSPRALSATGPIDFTNTCVVAGEELAPLPRTSAAVTATATATTTRAPRRTYLEACHGAGTGVPALVIPLSLAFSGTAAPDSHCLEPSAPAAGSTEAGWFPFRAGNSIDKNGHVHEGLPARDAPAHRGRAHCHRHHRGRAGGRPRERRHRRDRVHLLAAHDVLRAGERDGDRLPRGLHEPPQGARPARLVLRARRLGPAHREHLPRGHGSGQRPLALHGDAARDGRRVGAGARGRAAARDVAARP